MPRALKTIALLTLIISGFLLISASVFAEKQTRLDDTPEKLHVITTFTVIADIAKNIAGDAAIVDSIIPAGAEVHDYQPTPGDILKAQKSGLILWNGMNLERWFEKFFTDIQDVPHAIVTEGIDPIMIGADAYRGTPNPHAWMSPSNAIIYVDNIRQAMITADPENADIYNRNAAGYTEKIRAIEAPLKETLSAIPQDQRFLATSEGAFSYLARDLGMEEIYLWPVNAEQQGTPQQIRNAIDQIRAHDIPVIFSESTVSDRPAKQVARESGARYGGVLYVDSLGPEGSLVPDYLTLLEVTTATIAKGFGVGQNND